MSIELSQALPLAVLDALPNPVLVKDSETRYVWVNQAFEVLFEVDRITLEGRLDIDAFPQRQAAQCNGGDLRVLESGEVDEAVETVFDPALGPRETITRKSRIIVEGNHYLIGVIHDITEVTEQNRRLAEATDVLERQAIELEHFSATDMLTGCMNRRALFSYADELMDSTTSVGVVAIDLDHFKAVNDTYGHEAGDEALRHIVATTLEIIRSDDVIARRSGEEFIVLLPGADETKTNGIAERIRAAIAASPTGFGSNSIPLTASLGVVHHEGNETAGFKELLRLADERLYEAKRSGRNMAVSA